MTIPTPLKPLSFYRTSLNLNPSWGLNWSHPALQCFQRGRAHTGREHHISLYNETTGTSQSLNCFRVAWLHSCFSAVASPVPCPQGVPGICCPQEPLSGLIPTHSLSPGQQRSCSISSEPSCTAAATLLPWALDHSSASPLPLFLCSLYLTPPGL